MKKKLMWSLSVFAFLAVGVVQGQPAKVTPVNKTLQSFQSEEELQTFFKTQLIPFWDQQDKKNRRHSQVNKKYSGVESVSEMAMASNAVDKDESITNVQHAGVDEGGIVKAYGDYLVVLLRGRLFTVKVNDATSRKNMPLNPVAAINAYGADINPSGSWYDEMLISGNNIFVIGYSYARGGTEIGWFNIDRDGQLSYRSTYHLRSNDYYSSRNYASRLVQGKLVFYSGMPLNGWAVREGKQEQIFPAMRKWHKEAKMEEFKSTAQARQVYKPLPSVPLDQLTLHNVTSCEVVKEELNCQSSVVMGPYGHVFYVSPESVYVWTTASYRPPANDPGKNQAPESVLYRLPLNGSAPTALKVKGSPIDQMSFLESQKQLSVLIDGQGLGDGMWRSEQSDRRDLSLLRIPLSEFSDGLSSAKDQNYQLLPRPDSGVAQNRYVGDYLLYGSQNYRGSNNSLNNRVYAVRWQGGQSTYLLDLAQHGVERIEAMGRNAVVIGQGTGKNDEAAGLYFSALNLTGKTPVVASFYKKEGVAQSESRSHGFFYKEENTSRGVIGLPVVGNTRGEQSASIAFLSNQSLKLNPIGDLYTKDKIGNDNCVASCVDWYGNSRPIFYKGRIFALMGYEIVEGAVNAQGQIVEKNRVNFSSKNTVRK